MAEEKKAKEAEALKKKLEWERESAWLRFDEKTKKDAMRFAEPYKKFLAEHKTEYEFVEGIKREARKKGFKPFHEASFKPGSKFWIDNRGRSLFLFVLGQKPVSDGMKLIGSHIDALRLDLKPSPVFSDSGFGMLNLHYYGGIKKYHWVNVPLALHGHFFDSEGKRHDICWGENESEPTFLITDLLPHIGKALLEKKMEDVIPGESLDAIASNTPFHEKEASERVKLQLQKLLHDKFGLKEEDFVSADLTLVPAHNPRDVGLDNSMVAAYAQDDRSCSYALLQTILETEKPKHTAVAVFYDKEEIGSFGNTGAGSFFLEKIVQDVLDALKEKGTALQALAKSKMLSADVTDAVDPKFKEFFDMTNANYLGLGVAVEKYGGGGGKYSTTDASAEFVSEIRQMLNKEKIPWQTGEIAKVDDGGGGTIAVYVARYGLDVIDIGPPVLAMHSPYELISKADLYCAFLAYKAFLR